MFDRLADEMSSVQTAKFFVVDGPMPAEKRSALEQLNAPLPPSYYEFIYRFGNAKLFRTGSQYRVYVFAEPKIEHKVDGSAWICFGKSNDHTAFLKLDLLVHGAETPVFEFDHRISRSKLVAKGFEEWLNASYARAKKRYTKREWKAIIAGPPPFSDYEQRIVQARRQFRWRIAGISPEGSVQFEITNGSDIVLPYLSIGIRGKRRGTDAELHGGAWLPVSDILPGQTAIIEKDCYVEWVDPSDVIAFDYPDPAPEDRDQFWEFRSAT